MDFSALKSHLTFEFSPTRTIILGYLVVIFTGAVLLSLPQATSGARTVSFIDALFTSTSAVCVTGLIVVNTAAHWSLFGKLVILLLIQIGGLGIMSLSTLAILIIGKRLLLSRRRLIRQDIGTLNQAGLLQLIRYIVTLSLVAETIGAGLIFTSLVQKMNPLRAAWFSIFHSVSAFNNAGFDIFGNSLESFTTDPIMNFTIIGLIILGGIGFSVIYEFGEKIFNRENLSNLSLHSKTVFMTTGILLLLGLVVIYGLEMDNPRTMKNLSGGHRLLASFFLSVTPRTAGFNTVSTGALKTTTLLFIVFLMYVGASPGSTGGGVKTTTFTALMQQLNAYILGKKYVSIYKRRLSRDLIRKAMVICFLALILIFSCSVLLTLTESADYIDILFETTSAFGTVGLSTGITGELSNSGRIIIIVLMFAGRLGPLTFAIGLRRVQAHKAGYSYPEENIMVG